MTETVQGFGQQNVFYVKAFASRLFINLNDTLKAMKI
jgi:hypothetical protein